MKRLADQTALIVGMGGLGCPTALALARAGVGRLILIDEDEVEVENLHRQILYQNTDVGRPKVEKAALSLVSDPENRSEVDARKVRFVPENAESLVKDADVVVEGSDNFATKFLACDAARLLEKPVVHGAAIRWHGTALLTCPEGRPCYRCLFEDLLPDHLAPSCSTAGVVGPIVGIIGALMADLALDALEGSFDRTGHILSVDAKRMTFRETPIYPRKSCPTCRTEVPFSGPLTRARYEAPLHL
jgi:molybdopterin/thiamine biosynthesis adenylyltransferase